MDRSWIWMLAVLAPMALGCQEEDDDTASAQPPQAVAPVEVTADEATPEGEDEVTQLRARVAELEARIASCGCEAPAEGGTETVPVPEGVEAEVPEGVEVPEGAQAEASEAGEASDEGDDEGAETASARRRRGQREPTLLGTLLGDEEEAERERRRVRREARRSGSDDEGEAVELPNPARILLGE